MTDNGEHLEDTREKLLYVIASLEDMGQIFTESSDFEKSTKYLLRILLGTVGISRGAIHIYLSNSNRLRLQAETNLKDTPPVMELAGKDAQKLARDALPQLITSLPRYFTKAFAPFKDFWEANDIHAVMPLAVNSDFLGIVSLGPRFMKTGYDADDLELLRLLAMHISLYFKSQKLVKQSREANFKLNRKILEMEQLFDVGLTITRLDTRDALTREILQRATAILDARYGALWLLADNGEYGISSAFGFNLESEALPDMMMDFQGYHPENLPAPGEHPYCLAVPIRTGSGEFGHIAVAGKEHRKHGFITFTDDDTQLLSAFANQAAVALENAKLHESALEKERMDQELKVAAEIQESLLPSHPPRLNGFDISAATVSCRTVGGDFFDFFNAPHEQMGIIIADVSGKSTPAAMLVSTLHGALHAMIHRFSTPESLATELNILIAATTPDNKFITAVLMVLDPVKGMVTSVSAGHEPVLLIRADGSLESINAGGLILGLFPHTGYESETVELHPGDLMILYTDGITDLLDSKGETFGLDRLKKICVENRSRSASEIRKTVFHCLECFRGPTPAPDDRTMVVVKKTR